MILKFIFAILLFYVIIRTTAYGIFSFKTTGSLSGISVFILTAATMGTGYIVLFR